MGPQLREEVEQQLLRDLEHYGLPSAALGIDWSDVSQEGHMTEILNGELEELSGIAVVDPSGNFVAEGWMDFIHGGDKNPLFVFWLFLSIDRDGKEDKVKCEPTIPEHVWNRLPEESKVICAEAESYDSRWVDDPLVRKWRQQRRSANQGIQDTR